MSRSVGEALPDDAHQRQFGAVGIVQAEPYAGQALLTIVLVDATHSAHARRAVLDHAVAAELTGRPSMVMIGEAGVAEERSHGLGVHGW